MSLDVLAATMKYYHLKAKAINKKEAEEKGKKASRVSVLGENRANSSHMYLFEDMFPFADKRRDFWKHKRDLYKDLNQKSIDMELQLEDLENAFSKGR